MYDNFAFGRRVADGKVIQSLSTFQIQQNLGVGILYFSKKHLRGPTTEMNKWQSMFHPLPTILHI